MITSDLRQPFYLLMVFIELMTKTVLLDSELKRPDDESGGGEKEDGSSNQSQRST